MKALAPWGGGGWGVVFGGEQRHVCPEKK